jgi:hypothetical protein
MRQSLAEFPSNQSEIFARLVSSPDYLLSIQCLAIANKYAYLTHRTGDGLILAPFSSNIGLSTPKLAWYVVLETPGIAHRNG